MTPEQEKRLEEIRASAASFMCARPCAHCDAIAIADALKAERDRYREALLAAKRYMACVVEVGPEHCSQYCEEAWDKVVAALSSPEHADSSLPSKSGSKSPKADGPAGTGKHTQGAPHGEHRTQSGEAVQRIQRPGAQPVEDVGRQGRPKVGAAERPSPSQVDCGRGGVDEVAQPRTFTEEDIERALKATGWRCWHVNGNCESSEHFKPCELHVFRRALSSGGGQG